jgi:hypothetical protein
VTLLRECTVQVAIFFFLEQFNIYVLFVIIRCLFFFSENVLYEVCFSVFPPLPTIKIGGIS